MYGELLILIKDLIVLVLLIMFINRLVLTCQELLMLWENSEQKYNSLRYSQETLYILHLRAHQEDMLRWSAVYLMGRFL